jgi:dehydrogenase/reductase SDR family member 1
MRLRNEPRQQCAIVTGGTRGVGRGVGRELARQGARVFITGRSAPDHERPEERIIGIRCDHRVDTQVKAAFNRILSEASAIDFLVNNLWGGYEGMAEDGNFTWTKPFWNQPLCWDAMFSPGVRAHYQARQLAAPAMIAGSGASYISFSAARKHIGNVVYGVSKAATDKMTADMATALPILGRGKSGRPLSLHAEIQF